MSSLLSDLRLLTRAPADLLRLVARFHDLLWALTSRHLTQNHAGQVLGFAWTVIHPLAQAGIYVVIFSIVLGVRTTGAAGGTASYPAYLLSGMLPWLSCALVIGLSASEIRAQSNLVKQIVFPTELLPLRLVLASSVVLGIHLVVLLVYLLVTTTPAVSYLMLPVLFLLQVVALAGIAFAIAAITVFLPDVREILQVLISIGPFVAPILYDVDMAPAALRGVLWANPFTHMVLCYHDALYYQELRHPVSWIIWPLFSVVSLCAGYRLFGRLKPFFGGVL